MRVRNQTTSIITQNPIQSAIIPNPLPSIPSILYHNHHIVVRMTPEGIDLRLDLRVKGIPEKSVIDQEGLLRILTTSRILTPSRILTSLKILTPITLLPRIFPQKR
jgi:hypothetical protein